jgi:hypothetical protein
VRFAALPENSLFIDAVVLPIKEFYPSTGLQRVSGFSNRPISKRTNES